ERAKLTSEGALAADERREREGDDHQVAADREVLDVLALHGEPLLERQVPAAGDLHRPRQARLDREPEPLRVRVALDEIGLLGSRPDDAHLSAQDVHELRELVEARPAEKPPDARHTWVVLELEYRLLQA